jgi:hypothetical protein
MPTTIRWRVPYVAFVVDAGETIRAFVLSLCHLPEYFPQGKTAVYWKMTDEYLKRYAADKEIKTFEFKTQTTCWWEDAT